MIKINLIKNKIHQVLRIPVRRIIQWNPNYKRKICFHNFRLRKYNSYSSYNYNNDGGGGGNNNNNSFFIILLFGLYYNYKK